MNELQAAFSRLYEIIVKLRSSSGCPWDREQTPESLKSALLEEVYETIDAIEEGDNHHIKEELGDMFLLTLMISYMKEQEKIFSVADSLNEASDKLVRRHPHVFGNVTLESTSAVLKQWDEIKKNVEGRKEDTSILKSVPRTIPPLERAFRLQKKASSAGFDWTDKNQVWDKVFEELNELKNAYDEKDREESEQEFGDFLFSIINICRFLDFDPAISLHKTNNKFYRRFAYIEKKMKAINKELSEDNFNLMDSFWDEAKKNGL